jgi:hypothetical protein
MKARTLLLVSAGAAFPAGWVGPATAQMAGSEPLATCLREFLHDDASLFRELMSMASIWCGPSHAYGEGVRMVSGSNAMPERAATLSFTIKHFVEPADWLRAASLKSTLTAAVDEDGLVVSHRWLKMPDYVTPDGVSVEVLAMIVEEVTGTTGICVSALNADTRMTSADYCRELAGQSDEVVVTEILSQLSGVRW